MLLDKEAVNIEEMLARADAILEACSRYVNEHFRKIKSCRLNGIQRAYRIFRLQAEYFIVHHTEYMQLKELEDRLFFESEHEEYYSRYLEAKQSHRKLLVEAIEAGLKDGTIKSALDPKQEAAIWDGAFTAVLQSECEKLEVSDQVVGSEILKVIHERVGMSIRLLQNV